MKKNIIKNTQLDKFKQLAKELNCDESEAAFEKKLKKLAEKKPQQSEEKNG